MSFIANNEPQYIQGEEYYRQEDYCLVEELPQFTAEDYETEEYYFNEYDQEMAEAVDEADYYDQEQEEQEETQEEAEFVDDSLLKLIVGVQSYLVEAPKDSPLLALQYKMYTYLKQRAFDMGMDITPLE